MKLIMTPEFSDKAVSSGSETLGDAAKFATAIEKLSISQLDGDPAFQKVSGEAELYIWKGSSAWIIFSVEARDGGEEYALAADVVSHAAQGGSARPASGGYYATNDPKRDSSINPLRNSAINPTKNSTINPRFNSQINPRFNSQINPRFNSQLNPRFNSQLNIRYNSSINPRFNSSLNPRFNSAINLRRNRSFGGPFVYDLNLNQIGYLVRANDDVTLVFDPESELMWVAVKHGNGGFVVFKDGTEFTEHWEANGQGGFNRFDADKWTGFVV